LESQSANRAIPNNKPDVVTRDSEKSMYVLTDMAISGARNVNKEEAENISYIVTLQ
jgi:hypothetical protein